MKVVDDRHEAIEVRIDAYLDGLLTPAEARETERLLIDPDVARALGEALALRELLTTAPGEVTPADLAERIIGALGVAESPTVAARADDDEVGEASTARAVLGGVGTVRYALGPLSLLGASNNDELAPRRRGWLRALGLWRSR